MFTGIVTDVGEIVSLEDHGSAKRIAIACGYPLDSIPIGASIANAGICLTVTRSSIWPWPLLSLLFQRPVRHDQ